MADIKRNQNAILNQAERLAPGSRNRIKRLLLKSPPAARTGIFATVLATTRHRCLIAVVAWLLFTAASHCQQPVPVLPPETNWGKIEQVERNFTIKGNARWEGVGRVRDDGRVFILWTLLDTGEPYPGVYEFKDGSLVGFYGHWSTAKVEKDGTITGSVSAETIYPSEAPPVEDD